VTQKQVYRTLFEELYHAREWQLVDQLASGKLATGSPAFVQANLYALNYALIYGGKNGDRKTYNAQPLEYWAKRAADLITDIAFSQ
jgi:hypothetical protein